MPLVKSTLVDAVKAALDIGSDANQDLENEVSADDLRQQQAEAIATAFDDYIKSADIIIPAGIPVTTAGSPTSQAGATTAPSAPATIS